MKHVKLFEDFINEAARVGRSSWRNVLADLKYEGWDINGNVATKSIGDDKERVEITNYGDDNVQYTVYNTKGKEVNSGSFDAEGLSAGELNSEIWNYTNESEQFIAESHFAVGDKVKCIKSGMTGEVVSLDDPAETPDAKYYNVKREDGETVKYAPAELRLVESKVNEGITFQELVDKYKDNPYGIGADSIEYVESKNWGNSLVLRFEDNYGRKEAEAELKKMGIKAKKMSKSTADKAFKYRYELTVFE